MREAYKVCVLLSTYNGKKYFAEQVNSILNQKDVDIYILIRDDGSSDGTLDIIRDYIGRYPEKIECVNLEDSFNVGWRQSFFNLLEYASSHYLDEMDFFSFADQDDVWLNDKLVKACDQLSNIRDEGLYFSNTTVVDEALHYLRMGLCFYSGSVMDILNKPSACGCTMVFNRKYASWFGGLLKKNVVYPCAHDALLYYLALYADVQIIYDTKSYILYRQHDNNVVGSLKKETLYDWVIKIRKVFLKREHYNQRIARFIVQNFAQFTDENRKLLELIILYNSSLKLKYGLLRLYIEHTRMSWLKIKNVMRIVLNFV